MIRVCSKLSLPIEIVTQTTAVLGIRGSGKSTTARKLVEEAIAAGQRVLVIDPTDVWWGLKSSSDGKRAGLPVVVLGGDHGDLPLPETAGRIIADFIVEGEGSAILSVRHLRKGKQVTLVTAFAEQLYYRKGATKHRTPILIVVDECDAFVPQNPRQRGEISRCIGAIEDLVRKGRAAGIGVVLISQRPASINKDVLTQAETMICHRVTAPHDRKSLREWIDAHDTKEQGAEFFGSLASLKVGEAWFWSPLLDLFKRVKVDKPNTFDSSKTPKLGERLVAPMKLAKIDIDALKQNLADLVEDKEANDPKKLKRIIADLERQLKAKPKPAPVEKRDDSRHQLVAIIKQAGALQRQVDSAMKQLGVVESALQNMNIGTAINTVVRPQLVAPKTPPATKKDPTGANGSNGLGGGALRMVKVLAMRHPAKFTETQWATWSKLKKSGGTWSTYKSRLMVAGLVEKNGNLWTATDLAVERYGDTSGSPQTREEILDMWKGKLGSGPARLITILDANDGMSKQELAEEAELTASAGTFGTYLSRVRANGLLDESDGVLRLAAIA